MSDQTRLAHGIAWMSSCVSVALTDHGYHNGVFRDSLAGIVRGLLKGNDERKWHNVSRHLLHS